MAHLARTASLLLAAFLATGAAAQVNRFNEPKAKRDAQQAEKSAGVAQKAEYPPTPKKNVNAKVDFRNKKAPIFRIERWLNGEANRTNKTVLIDFWATWCPPCRALTPTLIEWQSKYRDDLIIVGVSAEDPQTVLNYMREHKTNYAMAIDSKQKMAKDVGVNGIPHVLVVSSDGIVRWQGFPFSQDEQLTEDTLVKIIEADKAARAEKKAAAKKAKEAKDAKPTDTGAEKKDSEKAPAPAPVSPKNPGELKQDAPAPKDN